MKKKFNITGLCIKEKHYMVDVSEKINRIIEMVEHGDYFTINKPRQFGKTTILNLLCNALQKNYIVIKISFEGVGDDMFNNEESFCNALFEIFIKALSIREPQYADLMTSFDGVKTFIEFSNIISKFIKNCDRPVVLIIDEVDKSSNSRVFLQFLGLLRNKYLAAAEGRDISFQSVILAGVHDVRTLKLAIRDDNDTKFNSPWNISAKFDVDMSFNPKEIESMLIEYKEDTGSNLNTSKLSELIYMFTSGYPYLISDICKIIDEKLNAAWMDESIYTAVKMMLNEKNTLFEDVIKNIENNKEIKAVVYELLILGQSINYNPYAYESGIMYGIFKEKENKLVIHNMIFEELIYNFMMEQENIRKMQVPISSMEKSNFIFDGQLNLSGVLLRFQEFMSQEYRKEDEHFYEAQGRLIFLAYLKPILNGKGFYFVEPETRENKRLDIVIIVGKNKYVVELKIWSGQKYEEKGLQQLSEYLKIQGLIEGYLLIFNFNKKKRKIAEWVEVNEKRIFEVII